jgi:hypothetical protein
MRQVCIAVCLVAALLLPSAAGAARAKWMPPLSRTADSSARLTGELADLARARASVKTSELPRTGADPGLIALLGMGLGLTGAGMRRLRPPV